MNFKVPKSPFLAHFQEKPILNREIYTTYLVLFVDCTELGTVLIETILSGDSLYIDKVGFNFSIRCATVKVGAFPIKLRLTTTSQKWFVCIFQGIYRHKVKGKV